MIVCALWYINLATAFGSEIERRERHSKISRSRSHMSKAFQSNECLTLLFCSILDEWSTYIEKRVFFCFYFHYWNTEFLNVAICNSFLLVAKSSWFLPFLYLDVVIIYSLLVSLLKFVQLGKQNWSRVWQEIKTSWCSCTKRNTLGSYPRDKYGGNP